MTTPDFILVLCHKWVKSTEYVDPAIALSLATIRDRDQARLPDSESEKKRF